MIDSLNQELEKYQDLLKVKQEYMELTRENASLKLKYLEENEKKDKNILELQDRLAFYETLTKIIIENESQDGDVYNCIISHSNYTLKFSLKPCFEEELSKIEYKPVSFYKDNTLIDLSNIKVQYLKKKIKFEESFAPQFLMRLFKALEEINI